MSAAQVQVRLRAGLQGDSVYLIRRLHHVSFSRDPLGPADMLNRRLVFVSSAQLALGLLWALRCACPRRTQTSRRMQGADLQQVGCTTLNLNHECLQMELGVHGSGSVMGAVGMADRHGGRELRETCPASMMHIPYKCAGGGVARSGSM
jgi:hypothetical protein